MLSDWPIGVFTSIDEGLGLSWEVLPHLDLRTIQLHAPASARRTPEHAKQIKTRLGDLGIEVTAIFAGFPGESYADIPTTRRTVGLVPPETRRDRLEEMKQVVEFASWLDCPVAALHLGFIPQANEHPEAYQEIVEVTCTVCDYCQKFGQNLHLETGQETAEHLIQFMRDVQRGNLFVNFDPANMILYGTGEPVEALKKLGSQVRSVHCKDARWASRPGQEWGQEVPLGEGDVDLPRFLQTLRTLNYQGPLTIEREIPHEPERQRREIGASIALLRRMMEQVL